MTKNCKWLLCLLLLVTVAISCFFAACDLTDHKHKYDGYANDDTYHWQSCAKCDETTSKTKHSYNAWVIVTAATATTQGERTATCTVCNYVLCETILPLGANHQHDYGEVYLYSTQGHWQQCGCGTETEFVSHSFGQWIVVKEATSKEEGAKKRSCVACGYVENKTLPVVNPNLTRTVKLFAINDFHGEVDNMAKIGGYLNGMDNGNAVFINSGDMFQGSIASNSNYGELLTQCSIDAGFDCITYGNHEFDWGVDRMIYLNANYGEQIPFLGANIYEWNKNTNDFGDFCDDLAKPYTTKTLDNGLKVGIIGVIGEDQYTSICNNLVENIGFKNPADVIPDIANTLRNDEDCDVVVVSAHTGQSTFLNDSEFDVTQYADAVFCAHTHADEITTKNGVPFIQGDSYGRMVSQVVLKVDKKGNVSCESSQNVGTNYTWTANSAIDAKVKAAKAAVSAEASEVLTVADAYLSSDVALPRLACHAIADYAVSQGYDINLAMVNNARSGIYGGNLTYEELYQSLPFDNTVFIAKVQGRQIKNQAKYSSIWRVKGEAIEDNKYYTIAIIDYLMYHVGVNHQYNYMSTAFTSGFTPVALTKAGVDGVYNYRLITRDFLRSKDKISASTYTTDSAHTNVYDLGNAVSINNTGTEHFGTLADPFTAADVAKHATAYKNSSFEAALTAKVANVANAKLSSSGSLGGFSLVDEGTAGGITVVGLDKCYYDNANENWQSVGDLSNGTTLTVWGTFVVDEQGNASLSQGVCVKIGNNLVNGTSETNPCSVTQAKLYCQMFGETGTSIYMRCVLPANTIKRAGVASCTVRSMDGGDLIYAYKFAITNGNWEEIDFTQTQYLILLGTAKNYNGTLEIANSGIKTVL